MVVYGNTTGRDGDSDWSTSLVFLQTQSVFFNNGNLRVDSGCHI